MLINILVQDIVINVSATVDDTNQLVSVNVVDTIENINVQVDEVGIPGPPGALQWIDYASMWDTEPAQISASVYSYTWNGVTRYRFVPSPYQASQDAFYSDLGLTQLIVRRGS
jgi:hypothetical protein